MGCPCWTRICLPAKPLPSLDDARALTPTSDFQPFMRPGVTADVRNVAMKKLFTDPHFNVMDGLDIYIDDYSVSDPIPEAMLKQMKHAQDIIVAGEERRAEAKKLEEAEAEAEQQRLAAAGSEESGTQAALPAETQEPVAEVIAEPPEPQNKSPRPV